MSSCNKEIVRRKRGAALIWIKVRPSRTERHPPESMFSKCVTFLQCFTRNVSLLAKATYYTGLSLSSGCPL